MLQVSLAVLTLAICQTLNNLLPGEFVNWDNAN